MRSRIIQSIILISALLMGCGPASAPSQSNLPTTPMQIGSKNYTLEIAADEYSRQHGLMERDSMPPDHGMIFVFKTDTSEGFWMHHTRIPLDILFVDASGKIISQATMKPYDEHTTESGGAYRYAIELNAGAIGETGVKPGERLSIPPAATAGK